MTNSPKLRLSLLALLFVGSFALAETYTDDTVPSAPSNINTNTEFAITNSATYTGTISGGTITKTGAGTLTLTNSITKATITSNAGKLALGTSGNTINIGSDATIKPNGGTVSVDGKIVVNSGKLFVSGTWTGDGKISVDSKGQFRISGSYSYPTGITLNGGLLMNAAGSTLTVTSPVTVETASNVQAGYGKESGILKLNSGVYGSGNLTVNTDSNMGWVWFSGAGNYEGSLTLIGKICTGASGIGTAGAPADASSYIGSKEIQFKGGILHNYDNFITLSNDLNFDSDSSIMAGWSKDITLTGKIKGSGKFTAASDSGWVIAKTETQTTYGSFTGAVQTSWDSASSVGKLKLGAEQPFGPDAGQGRIYGQLDMNGFSQVFKGLYSNTSGNTKKGHIFNDTNNLSTLTLDITGYNDTYQGKITGNIELVVNSDGTGTQTFANNGSNFTGNVVINGGTVSATAGHASYTTTALGKFSVTGGRTITVNSGAELVLGTNDVLGGCTISNFNENSMRLILNGGKVTGSNNNPLYNATFKNGAEVYGNNNRATYQSFWLLGTNTVSFAGDGSTPESPVKFNGASGVIYVLDGTILNVDDITLSNASDLVVNVILGDMSQNSVTNNSLTKTGAGTVELTKANEYTAGTTISEGVLKFTDNAVVANGPITVGADGTLEYNLSSGKTQLLTIYETEDSNNKIKSTGQVVKTGDGTLQICTSAAGQVDAASFVVSSGRLDMKEYFKGSLAVEAGATLSPGNSVGTLTVDGEFSLDSGATLLMEVGKNEQGEIVVDQLILSEVNEDTFASGSIINIVLDPDRGLVGGDSFTDLVFITTSSADDAARIFDAVDNATISYYFPGFEVKRDGNNILLSGTLDSNAVPEPSTWALLVLGVAGLMYWRRRKN